MADYLNDAVKAICDSVRIDSSMQPPLPNMPFGKGATVCLRHFLGLAEMLGFQTKNYDNYIGEVIFEKGTPRGFLAPLENNDSFAVLAHLDVVPAGSGWTEEPFGGVVKNGRIYGRGAMDDKGPAIAALYAMKKLKDSGFIPKKTIKLIVGLNEENGWKCIEHYKKVATLPKVGFSPDANFPVIYAEKGILHLRIDFPVDTRLFTSFEGGRAVNMVCDHAEAVPVKSISKRKAMRCGLKIKDGKLISEGKSAHGSTPQQGINAILPMLQYFELDRIVDILFKDIYGLRLLEDETGSLTFSPDIVHYENGLLSFSCDIRYPATRKLNEIGEKLQLFGAEYKVLSHQPPLFLDKNGPLISTLAKVYDDYTGKKHEPIAIGGGTYARALVYGAAFGPEIEGEEVTIHQPDEYITIDRVKLMIDVYAEALRRLA